MAGTGVGKTTFHKSIMCNLAQEQGKKSGILFMEETPEETLTSLAGFWTKQTFDVPDIEYVLYSPEQTCNFLKIKQKQKKSEKKSKSFHSFAYH